MLRPPAVADQFYPGNPAELRRMVEGYLEPSAGPRPALAAVSPHAGYIFSGPVAGKVFSRVEVPRRVVVLGPNHRGLGAAAAVMSQGAWQTPLGRVELDSELGGRLAADCRLVQEDSTAHQFEHSLEVQVPFLQVLRDDLALTPLCLGRLDYDDCRELGQSLARVLSGLGEPALVVASTDMTHYEPEERAKQRDQQALERILALDPRGLHDTVRGQGITMCGVLPTTVALVAALEMGADSAELVAYSNSGEVTGDRRQVVGYAGLVIR